MNTEMPVEVVAADCLGTVRHTVHGGRVDMAVILHENGPAFPAPVAVNGLHHSRIRCAGRFRVNMVGSTPPFDSEYFSCPDILDLERRAFRNFIAAAFKPVEPFRGAVSSVRIGRSRFLRVG